MATKKQKKKSDRRSFQLQYINNRNNEYEPGFTKLDIPGVTGTTFAESDVRRTTLVADRFNIQRSKPKYG